MGIETRPTWTREKNLQKLSCSVPLEGPREKDRKKRRGMEGRGEDSTDLVEGVWIPTLVFRLRLKPLTLQVSLMFFRERQAECFLDLCKPSTCAYLSHQFPYGTELGNGALSTWKTATACTEHAVQDRYFPCFDTHLLISIWSPWQTWSHNVFAFSLGPSCKSFQQCYSLPTDMKEYVAKICISARLQNSSEDFSYFLFLVCFSCCYCWIITFTQAIAPPPVQNWALVWINRANEKVLLKVTFFFPCMKQNAENVNFYSFHLTFPSCVLQ